MSVTTEPTELPCLPRAVAIGTFDGVHLGHRKVIGRALIAGLVPTVVTFDPHPRRVLGREVQLITTVNRRLQLLATTGAMDVLMLRFSTSMARLQPAEWVDQVLRPIGARRIVVGANYRFGHRAAGTPETLRQLGFEVDTVQLTDGVSSSRIRELVRVGDLNGAASLLGRGTELSGCVLPQVLPGRFGLACEPGMVRPPSGTYAARVLGQNAQVKVGSAGDRIDVRMPHRSIEDPPPPGTMINVELTARFEAPTIARRGRTRMRSLSHAVASPRVPVTMATAEVR